MAKSGPPDLKLQSLRQNSSLNPHPNKVIDPLFGTSDFFDSRDLVQVKYEMVRRVRVDKQSVSHSARSFGLSRPSFYQAQDALDKGGLAALVPKRPGPRGAHKLSAEVMAFLTQEKSANASVSSTELAERVRERFSQKVHRRSIERAFARQKKKRP